MSNHSVKFYRCLDTAGEHRAVCTCGWSVREDNLEAAQTAASSHNLDEPKFPPLKVVGFVSGLPDE